MHAQSCTYSSPLHSLVLPMISSLQTESYNFMKRMNHNLVPEHIQFLRTTLLDCKKYVLPFPLLFFPCPFHLNPCFNHVETPQAQNIPSAAPDCKFSIILVPYRFQNAHFTFLTWTVLWVRPTAVLELFWCSEISFCSSINKMSCIPCFLVPQT